MKKVLIPVMGIVLSAQLLQAATCTPGVNIIKGGTFESSTSLDNWNKVRGSADIVLGKYSTGWAGAAASNAGSSFLYATGGEKVVVRKTYNIKSCVTANSSSPKDYNFNALMGGYGDGDNVAIKVAFKKTNGTVVESYETGPKTGSQSMSPVVKMGAVPATARKVTITMTFNRVSGQDIDGYVDNLSLIVKEPVPNNAPVANSQNISVNSASNKSITLTATDPDGDNLDYLITVAPTHGTLTGTPPNLTYVPDDPNYTGNDSFKFKVNDGNADSAEATVSITLTTNGSNAANKIINYGNDSDNPVPTTDDYTDAGITGVTDENVDMVNERVSAAHPTDANAIQDIVDDINNQVCVPGLNVINKGNSFENLSDLAYWNQIGTAHITRAKYSTGWAGTAPSGAGSYFLYAKGGDTVTVRRTLDISKCVSHGARTYNFNALMGGYGDGDTVSAKLVFRNGAGTVKHVYKTGDKTANRSMENVTDTFTLSPTTKKVTIVLTFKRNSGTDIDGYIDNLSLVLQDPNSNRAPVATAKTMTVLAGSENNPIKLTGTDLDHDSLTYRVVTQPAHGVLSGTAPNLTYSPDTTYTGSTDSFTFVANDGTVDSAPATVNIIITTETESALAKIQAYADDNSNAAPTTGDYAGAGVTGVTSENLAQLNAIVASKNASDVDTVAEIQALVDALNSNACILGTNVINNSLSAWKKRSGSAHLVSANYSTGWAGPKPAGVADSTFLYATGGSSLVVRQVIDVSTCNASTYDLSGYYGGFGDDDTVAVRVDFKKANNNKAANSYKSGDVTSNHEMIEFTDAGTVNNLTKVIVTLTFKRVEGTDIDGYVDNLSLILN